MTSITEPQALELIAQRIIDNWTETELVIGAESFDPVGLTEYMRFQVLPAFSRQSTLGPVGGRKFERGGIIGIQLFSERDKGQKRGQELVAATRAIFEGVSFGGVYVTNGTPSDVGPDGNYWQTNVAYDYDFEETR